MSLSRRQQRLLIGFDSELRADLRLAGLLGTLSVLNAESPMPGHEQLPAAAQDRAAAGSQSRDCLADPHGAHAAVWHRARGRRHVRAATTASDVWQIAGGQWRTAT